MTQLTEQQRILNEKLNTANNQLDAIRSGATSTGNLGVARFQDFMEQKLADLEIQETALKSEITRLVQEVEFLAKRAQGDYDEVVRQQIEQDPIAANLHQQLTSLELILSGYRASFGENHRRVKETQDALDQAKDALAKRQKEIGDIVRNSQKIQSNEALTARKLEYDERVKQLNEGRAEHRKLMADRAAYEKAEAKREEARLQLEAMNALIEKYTSLLRDPFLSRIKISGATIPWEPSAPKWYVHIPGGFMLGALAGLGLAFIIELSNKLLRRPEDVRRYLHIPLLGAICHEKDDDETEGVDLLHVVRQAPYSVMSECYRQFRTNLRLSESAANKKVLLVTSPSAGDGKTTVVMNLTSTFVAEGKKVLVIDTNFRRPSMATHFPRPAQGDSVSHADFGLSNYLMGQCSDPRDILRRSETEGLDIIDSGPIPPNPAEVLGSHAMKKLLDTFRDQYDYILLDGPALLVSDAKALAALAEGTIVVFNATRTRKDEAARILADLGKIQATVVGTVLLGVENIRGGYFGELHRAYKDYHKRNEPMAKPAN